ncbi:exodeoxyribonuclease VII small subunit [Apilactobacillus sp. TMW 2.2459]|uniref:Exodeoxyribonuclease 7 small subunit n=1 Tax=Apilactobacillus xinyiensis TaxID=2841032 RepID=A0ABT0I012_9LACO|nr:exodeoxyribonuclease VII small subunit [Apilactobacillus xinyiensis]MCK8624175.1 exodeoxyribonuclease VII small subunit [Apilactobacillus xinyiensis]MCL0311767.1 exodeoxyribonuclease VII small subunit [Apilactobacillus xinyiensis]
MSEEISFEQNMQNLEKIVNDLEQGDVPLEEALNKFKDGVELSNKLQQTLKNAENTLAKVVKADGQEHAFESSESEE